MDVGTEPEMRVIDINPKKERAKSWHSWVPSEPLPVMPASNIGANHDPAILLLIQLPAWKMAQLAGPLH